MEANERSGRLTPSNDLDKLVMREVMTNAIANMGEWKSGDGKYTLRFVVETDAEVTDDGHLPALLDSRLSTWDVSTVLDGSTEPATLQIDQDMSGRLHVLWTVGNEQNYVEPNCWVVR